LWVRTRTKSPGSGGGPKFLGSCVHTHHSWIMHPEPILLSQLSEPSSLLSVVRAQLSWVVCPNQSLMDPDTDPILLGPNPSPTDPLAEWVMRLDPSLLGHAPYPFLLNPVSRPISNGSCVRAQISWVIRPDPNLLD